MKKTLFVNSESEESKRVINLLEGRIDYIILELNSNCVLQLFLAAP